MNITPGISPLPILGTPVSKLGTVVDAATSEAASGSPWKRKPLKATAPAGTTAKAAPAAAAPPAKPNQPEKEWTVLFYLNGNNQLSKIGASTIHQLEFIGTTNNMNMVAQTSRAPGMLDRFTKEWTGTRRYQIDWNGTKLTTGVMINDMLGGLKPGKADIKSPVLEDMGQKVDMGNPDTLKDFVTWGMQAYPARHTMLVMVGPNDGVKGMMHDELAKSKMMLPEVRQALEAAEAANGGQKIDVLAIDGSQVATMETADELKGVANYLVGSESVQQGAGAPLMQIFNEIKNINDPKPRDPLTLVQFYNLINSAGAESASAIDLTKMDAIKTSWDNLSKAILKADVSGAKLRAIAGKTQDFQGVSTQASLADIKDGYHFAELLSKDDEIPADVKTAAQATMKSIDDSLVGDAHNGKYTDNAHGISVFMPTNFGHFRPDGMFVKENDHRGHYDDLAFAKDTAWTRVLDKMSKDSAFNSVMDKLGVSDATLDKLSGVAGTAGASYNLVGSIASMAGAINALAVLDGKPVGKFLVLNPVQSAAVGTFGSFFDGTQTVGASAQALRKYGDTDTAMGSVFDIAASTGKAVANASAFMPALAPYAHYAAIGWFAMPWIKQGWGLYTEYKQIKGETELGVGTSNLQQLEAAAVRRVDKQFVWDQIPATTKD